MFGKRPAQQKTRRPSTTLLAVWLVIAPCLCAPYLRAQSPPPQTPPPAASPAAHVAPLPSAPLPQAAGMDHLAGLTVAHIRIDGVALDRLAPLPGHLAQAVGKPLTQESVAQSLRQLYATGLFETIEATARRTPGGVDLDFRGRPRSFIGIVTVTGAKGPTLNSQLQRASGLDAGTRFLDSKLTLGLDQMRQAFADNGFHKPTITHTLTRHPAEQLVDIAFQVTSGLQARIGAVHVSGDSGLSDADFRRYAKLRLGAHVEHDTVNRALAGVLKHYRGRNRLEAEIKLVSQTWDPATNTVNYQFSATRGPVVNVRLVGAKLSDDRLQHLVPIYEEGTVDEDLLNEGSRGLRDYYQRLGYFDVKVEHARQTPRADIVDIVYTVTLGVRRRVERVTVSGNHYFDTGTLKDLLSVHTADTLDRHGAYSQALVENDVSSLTAVYHNNGFSSVRIQPQVSTIPSTKKGARGPLGLAVEYQITEGVQQRVGALTLEGNAHVPAADLLPLLNTASGQLLSPRNLAGDKDAILTDYLGRGFDHPNVSVEQQPEKADPNKVDIAFHITEGKQIFVRKVLITGLHYTRPETVAPAITLHPGAPLSQTKLIETQRNLYDFALFNEVNTAVENPNGGETHKTVLVQTTEARRWSLTYGLGFEAQTGTPQNNCRGAIASGTSCNPNGKTGISPRVLIDITRNDLFGREQSASIQSTYGLLEQKIYLLYQNPHFFGNRNFGLSFSGGYANSQDVTTYVASKLDAGVRFTEHFNSTGIGLSKANTFIYEYDFRRVKVAKNSLQVGPPELDPLSAAVRVGGPGFTWVRDTRDSPLDAHRGTYTSFQEFLSQKHFGSEAQFNRLDVTSSSYYGFDKNRLVIARSTRYAQERAFGSGSQELIPLPERIYSGGATSHRGFAINAAGPRDAWTGFPIGGAGALINSTELRLPPPTLPYLGNTLSFVLFEDMGNVFRNAGDIWRGALRIRQPNLNACKTLLSTTTAGYTPTGPTTSIGQQGECRFDYFSHAAGLGLRYHTPVGPIRLDFSYNLNPPVYPIYEDYAHPDFPPHIGEAGHFNFFFSLGQTF
ncbi:MAG TPA: POTRA domain-containing protein [Terracidiphilus sp.]|nr:POTRA domain-containing protein [Terracidiphilus sp.]